jgi:biopolymer transport protein ExbB
MNPVATALCLPSRSFVRRLVAVFLPSGQKAEHATACLRLTMKSVRRSGVIDYIQKGGLLMWPILVCSIISIGVFAERLLYLHRATIHVGEFLKGLSNLVQRRNFAEALHESAGTPGPVARVIHTALLRHDSPRSELREIVQEAGQLEVPKLERFLGVLATIAFLAPLLGLLGTVSGMIDAFGTIASNGGYATVTELSTGVYKSLLTAAAGLVVATPTFVAYSYLSSRVNAMLHDMERAGIEIVHMLTDNTPLSGIISFQQPAAKIADKSRD